MAFRCYVSNISKAWPRERQMEALDGREPVYEDRLNKAQLKRREPASLADRGRMLRPTARQGGEEIYVASLACFAWDVDDLARSLMAASARQATVIALDTGHEFPPGGDTTAQAFLDFTASKRKAQAAPGNPLGREIARANKIEDTKRRIGMIRQDWGDPAYTTKDLLMRAGPRPKVAMSYHLAAEHLGPRPKAIRATERKLAREAKADANEN